MEENGNEEGPESKGTASFRSVARFYTGTAIPAFERQGVRTAKRE